MRDYRLSSSLFAQGRAAPEIIMRSSIYNKQILNILTITIKKTINYLF